MSNDVSTQQATILKQAMRDRDKVRLRTLRSLRAALQNQEIGQRTEGTETTLDEQNQLAVLRKQINQRKDSIEQYEEAGRDDLVQKEREEIELDPPDGLLEVAGRLERHPGNRVALIA